MFALVILAVSGIVLAGNYPVFPRASDQSITNCVALSETSAQYTLPRMGDYYYVESLGNTAFLLSGANPTATAAINGHFAFVADGAILGPIRLSGAKVAYIGDVGAGTIGQVCFIWLKDSNGPGY